MGEASLLDGSAREVLARIVPGDPLDVRRFAGRRLRERALFLDLERVSLRAFAQVARDAASATRGSGGAGFVERSVDRAIDSLLDEDLDPFSCSDSEDSFDEPSVVAHELARPLGLDPRDVRDACVRFHALPQAVRRAFFLIVVDGQPVAANTPSERRIALDACRALRTLLPSDSPPPSVTS